MCILNAKVKKLKLGNECINSKTFAVLVWFVFVVVLWCFLSFSFFFWGGCYTVKEPVKRRLNYLFFSITFVS